MVTRASSETALDPEGGWMQPDTQKKIVTSAKINSGWRFIGCWFGLAFEFDQGPKV